MTIFSENRQKLNPDAKFADLQKIQEGVSAILEIGHAALAKCTHNITPEFKQPENVNLDTSDFRA